MNTNNKKYLAKSECISQAEWEFDGFHVTYDGIIYEQTALSRWGDFRRDVYCNRCHRRLMPSVCNDQVAFVCFGCETVVVSDTEANTTTLNNTADPSRFFNRDRVYDYITRQPIDDGVEVVKLHAPQSPDSLAFPVDERKGGNRYAV